MEVATVPQRSPRRKQPEEIQDHPTTTTISELPSPITSDILSRLPLQSIFSCQRVCFPFRNLTSDPYFAELQLPRSPLCQILYRSSESFSGCPTYLGFLPLHDSLEDLRRPRAPMKFEIPIEIPHCRLWVVSCNGLICLSDHFLPNNVYVCNPLTRQHFRLPKSRNEPIVSLYQRYERYFCWSGIGHSRSANLFKVVQFTLNSECERHFSIYTLGVDDEWRTLGDTGLLFPCNSYFVSLNGDLHWIGRQDSMLLICYFDMEKEQYGNLPLPSQFSGFNFHLGVVDNCLYISDERIYAVAINIWVMKEYGNIGSWTLEWTIQRPLPSGLYRDLIPIKTLEDGTVLMIVGATMKYLASYNPESKEFEKISHHDVKFWEGSIAGVLSFLPLPGL